MTPALAAAALAVLAALQVALAGDSAPLPDAAQPAARVAPTPVPPPSVPVGERAESGPL